MLPIVPGQYPGFFPQGGPQAPVMPGVERSPSVHSPIIPHAPPQDGKWTCQILRNTWDVLPGTLFREYHPTGPSEYVYHIEEPDDEQVIPSTPSSGSRSLLPVPGRGTVFIPPTPDTIQGPRHLPRSYTTHLSVPEVYLSHLVIYPMSYQSTTPWVALNILHRLTKRSLMFRRPHFPIQDI
jgi:hypothetical protein